MVKKVAFGVFVVASRGGAWFCLLGIDYQRGNA